jgi:large subunit ribosomal protein L17
MRHRRKVNKLNRPKAHREALIKNEIKSLFTHYGIVTTLSKAKEVRKFASKLIKLAKRGTIAQRRKVFSYLQDRDLVKRVFEVIVPRMEEKESGFTRIVQLGPRKGDGAILALLEIIGFEEERRKRQEELEERRKEREEKKLKGEEG